MKGVWEIVWLLKVGGDWLHQYCPFIVLIANAKVFCSAHLLNFKVSDCVNMFWLSQRMIANNTGSYLTVSHLTV